MAVEGKRLLLAAATTGYQTRRMAEAARRLGVECVLATDRCRSLEDPWCDGAIPVTFGEPSEAGRLAARFGRGWFDGVAAVGDRPAILAAEVAERLGLPFHSAAGARACCDKHLARRLFECSGLPVPRYRRIPIDADSEAIARKITFPCVLKPLGLSASRGVIRADTPAQFVAAFGRIRRILEAPEVRRHRSQQDRFVQVEDYIPGREFALEGIMTRGRLHVLALFDKPDPLEGPYFEETIYVTPSRAPAPVRRAIAEVSERAAEALGLRHGPVHAEMRVNEAGVWMLEVAARPIGGLCARVFRFPGEATLEEVIVRHALGEEVAGLELVDPAAGVMMIPIPRAGIYQGVRGVERAAAVPGIFAVEITAKQGQELVPLPEGNSYLGFLFARGETPEEAEQALRRAHGELDFEITAALPVVHFERGGT
jgi:biotin carboxylase